MLWIYLVLSGLFSGVLGAMGMGGGTILVPVLTLFMGFEQHISQGINLVVFIPTAVLAVIFHIKNKLIDFKAFLLLIFPAIASAIVFANLAASVDKGVLRVVFGAFLICVGIFEFVMSILKTRQKNKKFTEKLGI